MSTFQVNPAATKVEYTSAFDMEQLEKLGWDFSEFYWNRAENMAEKAKYASYEDAVFGREVEDPKGSIEYLDEATSLVKSEHLVYVRLRTEGDKLNTYFALYNKESNETYAYEPSGDDIKTVQDVIDLLNAKENYSQRTYDESQDIEGNYVDTFIQA